MGKSVSLCKILLFLFRKVYSITVFASFLCRFTPRTFYIDIQEASVCLVYYVTTKVMQRWKKEIKYGLVSYLVFDIPMFGFTSSVYHV